MWFLEHNDSDSAGLVWGQIIWICNKFPGNVDDAGPIHNWRIIATEKLVPLSMKLSPETNYPQSSRLTINCICFGSHKSIHWSDRYQCLYSEGFPCSSVGKESACNAGDPGLIPGSGRSLGEGNGNPLQYFFFYFMVIYLFNWKIIALQNCVGFCQTSTWINHRYT